MDLTIAKEFWSFSSVSAMVMLSFSKSFGRLKLFLTAPPNVPCYTSLTMKATFLLGSKADVPYAEKIAAVLDEFTIPTEIIVASAHKVPEMVVDVIAKLNADTEPQVVITVVGMSNGLGGVVAGGCVHPVVNCPPHEDLHEYMIDVHSSLRMPSEVPVMTVMGYKNAAIATARILGEADADLRQKVADRITALKAKY